MACSNKDSRGRATPARARKTGRNEMAYKLLLADDSITIQKVVELTLSEEDFEVTAYGDGESALEAARMLAPDVILADVFMPGLDGYRLCEKVKQDPALKNVPVLLLAGTFENFDEAAAARAGADDHITKPFESAELISKIKKLIETKGSGPEEALPAEPLEEAGLAEEAPDVAPVEEADDLWSVVDMQSETQPLAGATEVLTEEELWKRANLVPESEEAAAAPAAEEGLSWDELSAEPVMEAVDAEEAEEAPVAGEDDPFPEVSVQEEPEAEVAAALDMEEPDASVPADVAGPDEPVPMPDFESLDEAAVPDEIESPAPAVTSASAASVSPEMLRDEILKAVNSVLDQKIREALSAMGKDAIERVVWDVVPGLAEEIITGEIEKLKAGTE